MKKAWFLCVIVLMFGGVVPPRASAEYVPPTQPTTAPVSPEDQHLGDRKVVGLDYFFNHQVRNGKQFHYIWDDTDKASGFSKFGDVWKQYGATLGKLEKAPTADDLKKFSIYIIVNPNTAEKAADHKPNFIEEPAIGAIVSWVNDGGVLAIFANDKNNCEFTHLNDLSQKFGITFNDDLRNTVPRPTDRVRGTFNAGQFPKSPLFEGVSLIYMKEICTLQTAPPAEPLLIADKEDKSGKDIIMATAKVGKGFVFAVGDPWIYNEYIDIRTPDLPIQNRQAAMNLARWLLSQSSEPMSK